MTERYREKFLEKCRAKVESSETSFSYDWNDHGRESAPENQAVRFIQRGFAQVSGR